MLSTLAIVLPIFALVFAGWIARRTNALGPAATREVNRLVVYLALPALLFDIVANAAPEDIWQPGFITAFGGGCAVMLTLVIIIRAFQKVRLADSAIEALNAGYANTAYMGFPLMLSVSGEAGLKLALIASILTVCIAFAISIMLIELSLQSGGGIDPDVLRTAEVGQYASRVAVHPPVRKALFELQRRFAFQPGGAILDGRDIGTVVCPDAHVKFWVDADIETRAQRRTDELLAKGEPMTVETMLEQLRERDERDRSRAVAPMKPAEDAHLLDTTHLSIDAAREKARQIVDRVRAGLAHS